MKKTVAVMAFGLMIWGPMAQALTPNEVISSLQADGYNRVEVKVGPTQMKVEAIRGQQKLELVYDRSTGALLKREVEAVEAGDSVAPGVSVRDRGRDFVRVAGLQPDASSDDDDDHGGRGRGSDDDDGDDDSGSGRGNGSDDDDHDSDDDDDSDHDSDDDRGGDDSDDDSDDDSGGDNSDDD